MPAGCFSRRSEICNLPVNRRPQTKLMIGGRRLCAYNLNDSPMSKPRAISLFSGCGGSDLALLDSGYKIVWANDIWEPACETYKDNIRHPRIETGDIALFERFPKADLLVGCY